LWLAIPENFNSAEDYYNWLGKLVLISRDFNDEEIAELARLITTKWVGKRGRKINEDDEMYVLLKFYAPYDLTQASRPTRVDAIKSIMIDRKLSIDAAAKLYDKMMKRVGFTGAKRGRKKGNK
jgi:hypothetical protein